MASITMCVFHSHDCGDTVFTEFVGYRNQVHNESIPSGSCLGKFSGGVIVRALVDITLCRADLSLSLVTTSTRSMLRPPSSPLP